MDFSQYCTVGRRTGIVRGNVNDAGQSWQPQGFEELNTALTGRDGDPELWFAELDEFTPLLSDPAQMALLAEDELQRAARMTAVSLREHFLLSRLLLRRLLAARLSEVRGPTGERLVLSVSEHGKPVLAPDANSSTANTLHFNLSHCRGAWLLGVSHTAAIGVDIERPRRVDNALRLATRVFTSGERADLLAADAASVDERDMIFLRCWTRKEAVLKAIGSGFSLPAGDIEVATSVMPRSVSLPGSTDGAARVASLTLPVPGFAAWSLIGAGDIPAPRLRWLRP